MREKFDWNLAGKLFALALVMDIVIWAAVTYNYWGEISFSSREAMLGHMKNLCIYTVNSLVSTMGAIAYTNFINKLLGSKRTVGQLILRRSSTLMLILLTSSLLSFIYVKMGIESESDGIATGLSVSLISFFIAQIYATTKYFRDHVDFEHRKLVAELASSRLRSDNHFINNCLNQLNILIHTDQGGGLPDASCQASQSTIDT